MFEKQRDHKSSESMTYHNITPHHLAVVTVTYVILFTENTHTHYIWRQFEKKCQTNCNELIRNKVIVVVLLLYRTVQQSKNEQNLAPFQKDTIVLLQKISFTLHCQLRIWCRKNENNSVKQVLLELLSKNTQHWFHGQHTKLEIVLKSTNLKSKQIHTFLTNLSFSVKEISSAHLISLIFCDFSSEKQKQHGNTVPWCGCNVFALDSGMIGDKKKLQRISLEKTKQTIDWFIFMLFSHTLFHLERRNAIGLMCTLVWQVEWSAQTTSRHQPMDRMPSECRQMSLQAWFATEMQRICLITKIQIFQSMEVEKKRRKKLNVRDWVLKVYFPSFQLHTSSLVNKIIKFISFIYFQLEYV